MAHPLYWLGDRLLLPALCPMAFLLCLLVTCWDCHRDIAEAYAKTPMANSSGPVVATAEPVGAVSHAPSQTQYVIERDRDLLRLRWNATSVPLQFFIGSRRMGRSYGFSDDGYLYQAPVGYYANKRCWDMAPGYQTDREPDLNRPITAECLFCHASGARVEPATVNRIRNVSGLRGITCERCHGDGASHTATPRRDNIVNPARLHGPARAAVCEQCHLAGEARIVMPGKSLQDFRPGQELSDYLAVFVARGDSGVSVAGHSEALARSRCAQRSSMWCGTCHNPHQPVASYREKCVDCHAPAQCPVPAARTAECVACHMPKARAHDGGHTVFTDHSIPRRRTAAPSRGAVAELVPFHDRPVATAIAHRNLGLALASIGALETSWPLLRAAAQSKPADPVLYAQIGMLLEADGRLEQAANYYRLSLELDPTQHTALPRLGLLMARRGSAESARRLLEAALRSNPRQPAVRQALTALR